MKIYFYLENEKEIVVALVWFLRNAWDSIEVGGNNSWLYK